MPHGSYGPGTCKTIAVESISSIAITHVRTNSVMTDLLTVVQGSV